MPTATEYFGFHVTNVGPLTETFTPAPSCNDLPGLRGIASVSDNETTMYAPLSGCRFSSLETECFPSASIINSIFASVRRALDMGAVPYYSPAVACPSGWTTVGVATGGGGSSGDEGIITAVPTWGPGEQYPFVHVFSNVLDASETGAWCCPSDFKVNENGDCYSSLGPISSYSVSEYCVVIISNENVVTVSSVEGTAITPPVVSLTPAETSLLTSIRTIFRAEVTDYIVVQEVPAVMMVYKESDLSGDSNGDDSGDSGD
ncbi:hypothetical protein EDB81DRAFT_585285, partial [Dactylonectria macrodidyma]